jgi:hypothetical protein
MLILNECLFLLFISLSTQPGNFWIHPLITWLISQEDCIARRSSEVQEEIFWVMTPCSVVVGYQRFRGLHYPEYRGSMDFRSYGILPQQYTASQPENLDSKHHQLATLNWCVCYLDISISKGKGKGKVSPVL